jgi:hypothetical protein
MTNYFKIIIILGAGLITSACLYKDSSIPVVSVDLEQSNQMVTVTKWRICGPFRLPKENQPYTSEGLKEAFGRDYLTEIHGKEIPFEILRPTTNRAVDFEHDPNDDPDIGPSEVQFMNQVQQFPTPSVNTQVLFWRAGEFFKITYAAAVILSKTDTKAALIIGGNSPVKAWLNDEEILQSRASSVGHDPDALHILMTHLKKGRNTFLLKMFCFPKRNEFVLRIATREQALAFVREHGGLRDVIEEVIVPPGQPLPLSRNLLFFSLGQRAEARVEIADLNGQSILNEDIDLSSRSEIPTRDLLPGLYTITVSIDKWVFSENFYIGARDKITAPYEKRCALPRKPVGQLLDPCATLKPLQEIAPGQQFAFRLDWQKRALLLISQLEWALTHAQESRIPASALQGTHVFAYRSGVDDQIQHYFLHIPKNCDGRSVPLVVVVPHNTRQKPLLSGPTAFDTDWLRKLARYSDEFGYACLWPHGRGRNYNVHLALADTLEALDDVQKRIAIDTDRIYLTGDCGGARNALLFAERFPDRIAAVSVVNSAMSSGIKANALWREINSPRAAVENLSNIPLQLIHGDHFPHSPTRQSIELRDICRRAGMSSELILLPGDGRWADQDMFRLSFIFFQGKVRTTPRTVAMTTGQLKYGSAYWIRATELETPPRLGRITAHFDAPNKILATSSNISEIELLPDRFPTTYFQPGMLEMRVNGKIHTFHLRTSEPVKLRILPADEIDHGKKKTDILEGPVSHAFSEPFIIVQATGGTRHDQMQAEKIADQIEQAWLDNYYVRCLRKTDKEITYRDIASKNLVLTGRLYLNQDIKRICGELPFKLGVDYVKIGDKNLLNYEMLLSAIYPNPLNPKRYVVLVSSNSSSIVDLPAPELAHMGSYDVAVWRFDKSKDFQLLGQWYWDKSWRRLIPAGAVGSDVGPVEEDRE